MLARVVYADICGLAAYRILYRRWWWPFWSTAAVATSRADACRIAIDIRSGAMNP